MPESEGATPGAEERWKKVHREGLPGAQETPFSVAGPFRSDVCNVLDHEAKTMHASMANTRPKIWRGLTSATDWPASCNCMLSRAHSGAFSPWKFQ